MYHIFLHVTNCMILVPDSSMKLNGTKNYLWVSWLFYNFAADNNIV